MDGRFRVVVVVQGVMVLNRTFQQVIAVAMRENAVLTVDKETTSSSKRSAAHLEQFYRWVGGKHEVLVRVDEHEDDNEGAAYNHRVRHERNGRRREHRSQVDPSADRWRELADALIREQFRG